MNFMCFFEFVGNSLENDGRSLLNICKIIFVKISDGRVKNSTIIVNSTSDTKFDQSVREFSSHSMENLRTFRRKLKESCKNIGFVYLKKRGFEKYEQINCITLEMGGEWWLCKSLKNVAKFTSSSQISFDTAENELSDIEVLKVFANNYLMKL